MMREGDVADMHDDIDEVLITSEALRTRTAELARKIAEDYAGRSVLLVGILKGAVMFMVDLARALDIPVEMDFMAISSYGNSTESSGVVRIMKDLEESIEGKHVLIVEDIIDSGLTLQYLLESLLRRNPASLRVCTLLDKEKHRAKVLDPDYVGFRIPDRFVVGYGLDYAQHYRNLPYIGVLKSAIYTQPESDA
jgi:hypoxanthine phosphoribosyltransferase